MFFQKKVLLHSDLKQGQLGAEGGGHYQVLDFVKNWNTPPPHCHPPPIGQPFPSGSRWT